MTDSLGPMVEAARTCPRDELADKCYLSLSTIHKLAGGRRPTLETVAALIHGGALTKQAVLDDLSSNLDRLAEEFA